MKTVRLTMAQALVRFLENQYIRFDGEEHRFVRGVMLLPGHGNVVGLGQALGQERRDLEVYQGKNEQGMAHAAIAYAKQMKRKQIFAVTSSVGPGAANMVTAAGTATANNIPVLFLPGDVYACRQPDPVLQQIEQVHDMGLSTNDAFRPVCRYFDRVNRPEQLMSAMLNAFRVLTDPADTGAVCVALPQDVEGEAYDYPERFFERRVHVIERRPPTSEAVALAAARIREAKRPILICGGGVRYSEAHGAFRAFAEQFGIPFGETQAGKSAIEWTHPLNLGGIGVTGCAAANGIAKQADLVIGVGTRYTDFTTASKSLFGEDAGFVNISASPFQAAKLDAVAVVADAKAALVALAEALPGYGADWGDAVAEAKADWADELERLDHLRFTGEGYVPEVNDRNAESAQRFAKDLGASLTQTEVLGALNRLIEKDAVVIGSSGSLPGCMQRMWRARTPDSYHMEYGYSCMGYEISGALGVKLAVGEGQVYSMVGDGSFTMLHSELLTAVQERKKINVCLFDNASFGCINNLQTAQGGDTLATELRYRDGAGHDGAFLHVDYAMIARGYGAAGYTVRTLAQLEAALEDARKITDRPVLLDIKVLPKSMTDGYGAWWRVGTPEVSENERCREAWRNHQANEAQARKY
ncbi:MAG: 3D-(3,5/4)-trihydroxycyclohexane-1,2-dione acylhydrolase (decyclizing) [Eubacteriales bacterium]|nr:3D-(3,5/4)-trihydroxycyclohexane-1,2-dione acylhydrolase (decyclizing) [Christensenellaceae bacterium]MEA5066957.1 3D-(3,5/4)-trihydroxycyclohexane-1,2-dione acylhydrolase (decyclizing) [Eubacteriales bacterium]